MTIESAFNKQCKERYSSLGFRRALRAFAEQPYARIVNDVLQTFSLKRYNGGRECTVEFSVLPLCERIPFPHIGRYDLSDFEISTLFNEWNYDKSSDESINACVQDICEHIDRYLIPLFEEANCCAKALPALMAVDDRRRDNILLIRRLKGLENTQDSSNRHYFAGHEEKFFMAMKIGDYEYAKEAASVMFLHWRPESLAIDQPMLEQALAGNTAYVDEILHRQEQESLINLAKYKITP